MTVTTRMTEQEARERNGYLTTTGRVTGRAHEIEIWFAAEPERGGQTLYLLAGGRERADWVRNVARNGSVSFRAGGTTYRGVARIVGPDEPIDRRMREVVATKYGEREESGDLSEWARTSLPVLIELDGRDG
jgi:hypothetical protein